MRKTFLVLALTLLGVSACPFQTYAKDNGDVSAHHVGFHIEAGADLVSSYLWRGQNLGGLSIQPSVTLGWGGLYVSGWANIGANNWKFQNINPELDVTIGYDNFGFQIDLTHFYYFDGSYFPKNGFKMDYEPESSSTMEAHIGFHLGDLVEAVPLSVDWYTTIYGADHYVNSNDKLQRAWSSYLQVGYDFYLPWELVLGARVGLTPWRSMYAYTSTTNPDGTIELNYYEDVWKDAKTVAINNVNLRLDREFEIGFLTLGVWAECMLNCYGVNKDNFVTKIVRKAEQRFNWCIGGSVYIGNEW